MNIMIKLHLFRIFGELDFYPTTGFKFWKELENVLEQKFVQFRPKEVEFLDCC